MGGFLNFLQQYLPDEEVDFYTPGAGYWPSALRRGVGDLFGAGKSGVDYLASKSYANDYSVDPLSHVGKLTPRPGLEEFNTVPVEELLKSAVAPELEAEQKERIPTPYQNLYNFGRGGLGVAGRFGLDPLNPVMNIPGAAGRAVGGYFGVEGLLGAKEHGQRALDAPSLTEAIEPGVEAVGSGLMGLLGIKSLASGIKPRKYPELIETAKSGISDPLADIKPLGPEPKIADIEANANTIRDRFGNENTQIPKSQEHPLEDLIEPTRTLEGNDLYDTKFFNMTSEFLDRIRSFAAETLQEPRIMDMKIELGTIKPDTPAEYDNITNTIHINPSILSKGNTDYIADTLLHEIAHINALHDMPGFAPSDQPTPLQQKILQRLQGENVKDKELTDVMPHRAYSPIGEGKFAEVPLDLIGHTEPNINERAKYSKEEHSFQTARDALANNPKIRDIRDKYKQNVGILTAEEFARSRGLEPVSNLGSPTAMPKPEKTSDSAQLLHQILVGTKLTKFNKATLIRSLEEKGIPVPDDLAQQIPDLITELKDRGLLNEKMAGTYTVNTEAPKNLGQTKKTPDQIVSEATLEDQLQQSISSLEDVKSPEEKMVDSLVKQEGKRLESQEHYNKVGTEVDAHKHDNLAIRTQATLDRRSQKEYQTFKDNEGNTTYVNEDGEGIFITKDGLKVELNVKPGKWVDMSTQIYDRGKIKTKQESSKKQFKTRSADKLSPEDEAKIREIFGSVGKQVPEEVLLARELAGGGGKKPPKGPSDVDRTIPDQPDSGDTGPTDDRPERAFKVTLSDGTTHTVKGVDEGQITERVNEVLEAHGSTKVIDKIEPALSSLEKAAKDEIDPLKTAQDELKESLTDVGTETKLREEAQAKTLKDQLKVEDTFSKTKKLEKDKEAKLREEAHAEELKSQIKAEEDFKKAQEKGKKKSAKELERENRAKAKARADAEGSILNHPVAKVLNAVKSIAYGGDVGHLLRQGKQMNADLLFSKHFRKVFQQIPEIFKSAKSEDYFKAFHDKLYSDPQIKMMVDKFDLDMPGLGKNIKEEAFVGGGLAEKIPGIGRFYAKPSERAYTAGLNFLRAAEVKKLSEQLQKKGLTPENAPEKYQAIARAINIISQRGHFSPAYQKVFSDLSVVFGAPRAKAARIQNVFELFKGGESANTVRQTAAKTMAFNTAMYGLLATVLGAEFIDDPESGDFMKIRVNDKITVDPWMGLGVTARTIAKLQTGVKKSPYTGKTTKVNTGDALKDEFIGGLAPGIRMAIELYKGEDIRGYQISTTDALKNAAPLSSVQIAELIESGDWEQIFLLSMLQASGEGVDVFDYEKAKKEEKQLKQERGIKNPNAGGRRRKGSRSYPSLN